MKTAKDLTIRALTLLLAVWVTGQVWNKPAGIQAAAFIGTGAAIAGIWLLCRVSVGD